MADLLSSQIHEGIIFNSMKKQSTDPLWVVDRVDIDKDTHYLAVFEIAPESIKEYHRQGNNYLYLDKRYKFAEYQRTPYGKNPLTKLAKQAKALFDKQHINSRAKLYQKPIFTTVITHGEDTFSHKYGLGFYEHEQSRYQLIRGKKVYVVGNATGVFLSLDRVTWVKDFIPKDSLVQVLTEEINQVNSNYTELDTGVDSYFNY